LPIILIASAPSTRLTAAAEAIGTAEVVLARGTDVASIAQAALSAAGQLRPDGEPEPPSSWATIEVIPAALWLDRFRPFTLSD
jgi:hypothetical protein